MQVLNRNVYYHFHVCIIIIVNKVVIKIKIAHLNKERKILIIRELTSPLAAIYGHTALLHYACAVYCMNYEL